MSWIGLRDPHRGEFCAAGLSGRSSRSAPPAPDALLTRASLLIECSHEGIGARQTVLAFASDVPWASAMEISLDEMGVLRLIMVQGAQAQTFILPCDLDDPVDAMHIAFVWDAPARKGTLSLFLPDENRLFQTEVIGPVPMPIASARQIVTDRKSCVISSKVRFVALADHKVPVGPMPGLAGHALLETLDGPRPVSQLRPGQLVLTQDQDIAQIRWVGACELPARGRFAPMLLRAPYFGLNHDLMVSADQCIGLSGSEVEYLFGEEEVGVAARHLADNKSVLAVDGLKTLRYYQVLLDRHAILTVSGAPVESLDAAALLADPGTLAHSILGDMPAELRPHSTRPALPILRDFEAMTLVGLRAA